MLNQYVLSLYVTYKITSKYFQSDIIILVGENFKTLFYQIKFSTMSSFNIDQQFFTIELKVAEIRCNLMEEKLTIEIIRDKLIHTTSYFKPFDID